MLRAAILISHSQSRTNHSLDLGDRWRSMRLLSHVLLRQVCQNDYLSPGMLLVPILSISCNGLEFRSVPVRRPAYLPCLRRLGLCDQATSATPAHLLNAIKCHKTSDNSRNSPSCRQ